MFEDYEAQKKAKAVEDHVKQAGKYATLETYHIEQNRVDETPGVLARVWRRVRQVLGR